MLRTDPSNVFASLLRSAAPALLVVTVSVAVYANTLSNGFVVDDNYQIVENPLLRKAANLPEIFRTGVWEFAGRPSSYYRPIMYVAYLATYAIAGTAPWAYHLVNVLLHAAAALILYSVLRRLHREEASDAASIPVLLATLVFAVHPIHTEAVAWVASLPDLAYSGFTLLALLLYARDEGRFGVAYFGSLAAVLLAALSKEPGALAPAVLATYELAFRLRRDGVRRALVRLAPFALVVLVYVALRTLALGTVAPEMSRFPLSASAYAANVLVLLAAYLAKLVWPFPLSSWHFHEPVSSLWALRTLYSGVIVGAFGLAVLVGARRSRLVPVGAVLVVVPILPALYLPGLNQPLENAFAERYLFLPSAGVSLLVSLALQRAIAWRPRLATPVVAVSSIVLAAAGASTFARNRVWRDALSLFEDSAAKEPRSAVARMYYGFALMSRGRQTEGRRELQAAAALNPALVDDIVAKGLAFLSKGNSKNAILSMHNALTMNPGHAPAHFHLGVIYDERGWLDAAIQEYEAALRLGGPSAATHNNLGAAYARKGMRDRAVAHLEAALRIQPGDPEILANLERARRLP